jgi:hypothetical protein
VKDLCWTLGQYDIVAPVEAPDDLSAAALGLECDGKLPHTNTTNIWCREVWPIGRGARDVTQKNQQHFVVRLHPRVRRKSRPNLGFVVCDQEPANSSNAPSNW